MTTLRSAFVASAVGVLLVATAACSAVAPYAARVDGQRISEDDLIGDLRSIAANEQYLQLVEQTEQVRGIGEGTFDATFTALALTRQIYFTVIEAELESRDLRLTDEDREAARERWVQQLGEDIFEAFSADYQDTLVRRQAELDVLTVAVNELGSTEEAARDFYDDNNDEFATACVSHILVETEEEALALNDRLVAGEDFAELATAETLDEGTREAGGDLGCDITPDANLVNEFKLAVFTQPVGEVGAPVETTFGFHLVLVTEREVPPFEEVEEAARARATNPNTVLQILQDRVKDSRIDVNPKYGSFVKTGPSPRVVAPAEAATEADAGVEAVPEPAPSNP